MSRPESRLSPHVCARCGVPVRITNTGAWKHVNAGMTGKKSCGLSPKPTPRPA